MAEIIDSGKKTGRRSTRVDLTPMVDLGFLLITFFIFTTAMSKPTGLKIYLPQPVPEVHRTLITASGALTILLAGKKQIYYYEGMDPQTMRLANMNELRPLILEKKKKASSEKLMIIIKPGRDSNFQSLIQTLDEMTINNVKRYAMVDMEPIEFEIIQQLKH